MVESHLWVVPLIWSSVRVQVVFGEKGKMRILNRYLTLMNRFRLRLLRMMPRMCLSRMKMLAGERWHVREVKILHRASISALPMFLLLSTKKGMRREGRRTWSSKYPPTSTTHPSRTSNTLLLSPTHSPCFLTTSFHTGNWEGSLTISSALTVPNKRSASAICILARAFEIDDSGVRARVGTKGV